MVYNNNYEKKFFPKISKCFCCCCYSPDESFKYCVRIMTVVFFLLLIFAAITSNVISVIFMIVLIISHILLLKDVENLNILYMKQFIYIFFIYILELICNFGFILYYFFAYKYNNDYHNKVNNEIKLGTNKLNNFIFSKLKESELNDNYISQMVERQQIIRIIIAILVICLMIYYYLVNCSYIFDRIEDTNQAYTMKKIENGEKTEEKFNKEKEIQRMTK
ncbi:hypothetical protein BCR32DRAFT_290826 [Anaeromyces robustus]|uniref:Uncharacterized protein n=1 Tax=Anaeromyces robustus TaxID=1754192 RepID=A0A1Y1XHN9_9FUNG|nr:hypothetical protein BCR32DRAFT_290826 [Anaeromyces robustus]|eukprot:ORX85269.1 hypothetical protein BCR32DRAFT_290826 [Anaeromyces robustus]